MLYVSRGPHLTCMLASIGEEEILGSRSSVDADVGVVQETPTGGRVGVVEGRN